MAGNGLFRAFDEGIPAAQAFLFQPQGMAFDIQGNLYVADTNNQKVWKITGWQDQHGRWKWSL